MKQRKRIKSKRIIPIFFILVLSLFPTLPFVESAGYGEENENLGQFTDDYENADNVSVAVNVINNQTLDCMELNMSSMVNVVYDEFSLREYDFYGGSFVVAITWNIANNDELRMQSSVGSLGRGYEFFHVDRSWLDGKYVRFRWYCTLPGSNKVCDFKVWDGTYDRSSGADFPGGGEPPAKGNGELFSFRNTVINAWVTRDFQIDTSGGSEDNVTILWIVHDGWGDWFSHLYLDWIEINDSPNGADNLYTIDFSNSYSITMEQIGTEQDYGYVDTVGMSSGGYESEGYFITENYLDYTTGNSLALLTNASIPYGTSMTVQFSNDNATWVDNDGNVGSTTIEEGFYAIDLRDLNYTNIYDMYNFSGTPVLTPRLYQSRLVTTNGTAGAGPAGPGPTVIVESFFWIPIAIVLSIITALLVWMKFGNQ